MSSRTAYGESGTLQTSARDARAVGVFPGRAGARAGFTLLELVVVLAVLAVITAAVVPLYANSLSYVRLRAARNDFVSLLAYVQERAVSESMQYRVCLDEREGEYWVEQFLGAKKGKKDKETEYEAVESAWGAKRTFPTNLKLDRFKGPKSHEGHAGSRQKYIACYPNGASDQAELIFRDTKSRKRAFKVEVLGPMGKIKVTTGVQRVVVQ